MKQNTVILIIAMVFPSICMANVDIIPELKEIAADCIKCEKNGCNLLLGQVRSTYKNVVKNPEELWDYVLKQACDNNCPLGCFNYATALLDTKNPKIKENIVPAIEKACKFNWSSACFWVPKMKQQLGYVEKEFTISKDDSTYLIKPGESVGEITVKTKHEDLIKLFGKENITDEKSKLCAECDPASVTIIKHVAGNLEVVWNDDKREKISRVIISQTPSVWHTVEGIKVGATDKLMLELNGGESFFIWGYGWDYGGLHHSWGKGKLAKLKGIVFYWDTACFNQDKNRKKCDSMIKQISGEQPFSISDATTNDKDPLYEVIQRIDVVF